jgi:hypothetical protein
MTAAKALAYRRILTRIRRRGPLRIAMQHWSHTFLTSRLLHSGIRMLDGARDECSQRS